MKAVVAKLRLNSLYSIRVPFTWQSSQTYPVLPPSAVAGLFANALQRFRNDKTPEYYLDLIEDKVVWAGSRLLGQSTLRSYMTSAIVKWGSEIPFKFTNALGRQFAFTREVEVLSVFKDETIVEQLELALKRVPLFFGDSESAVTVEEVSAKEAEFSSQQEIETAYPVPFKESVRVISGAGKVMLMHERCGRGGIPLPLHAYIVPVSENRKLYTPSILRVRITEDRVIDIKGVGKVVKRKGVADVISSRQRRR